MGMFDNEVAADNAMRKFENLSKPAVGDFLEGAGTFTEATSLLTGRLEIGLIAKTIGIARKFTSGLGVATLEENVEHLGNATELAITRVEKKLEAEGVRIDEIERRVASSELEEGIAAAVLQAQRTKQKERLERMAWILANGVAENDLEPEGLDDMLRAAVELKEIDIVLLRELYKWQNRILTQRNMNPTSWYGEIQRANRDLFKSGFLNQQEHLSYRSSYSRLESLGLIQQIPSINNTDGVGFDHYALLVEGKKLYEHLQEIGASK